MARCAIGSGQTTTHYLLLVGSGVGLSASNAAKYAATLFDPVVIVVVVLIVWQRRGRGSGIVAASTMTVTVTVLIAGALSVAGSSYLRGIEFTTVARQRGTIPIPGILIVSGRWVGLIALFAIIGAVSLTVTGSWPVKAVAWSLAAAVLLAPAEQARIHVITSLFKHVAYGAWFGCIIAGYGIGALASAVPASKSRAALGVSAAAAVVTAIPGLLLAPYHYQSWPRATPLISAIRAELPAVSGPMVMEDSYLLEYYLGDRIPWEYVTSNYYFTYLNPVTGHYVTEPQVAYVDAIRNRYFSLIELSYSRDATDGYDSIIKSAVEKNSAYRLVRDIPFKTRTSSGNFLIWIRRDSEVRPY